MSAPTDNEIDSAAFLGMLRAWMKDSGTTYRDLAEKLAHLPLWTEAAGVTVPATGPEADAEQARRFAEWATPVIMAAARDAMKNQKVGILIRMSKDTSCAIYPGFSDTRAADTATSMCLPVL